MSSLKVGREHKARKALFTRGIRRGMLTLDEIDEALPAGSLSDAERWLLFYSLHAARVEIQDSDGRRVGLEELRASEGEPAESEAPDNSPAEGDALGEQQ